MKKNWIIPILAISFICFFIWLNVYERVKVVIEVQKKSIPAKIIDVQHFGENQNTAIKYEAIKYADKTDTYNLTNDVDFNNKFFVTTEYETQKKTIGRNPLRESETMTNYFYLYIYDISSNKAKLIKKIDVYEKMKQQYSEKDLNIVYRRISIDKNHYYSVFGIYSSDGKKIDSTMLYDISQDKWISDENWNINKYKWNSFKGESTILYTSNFSDRWFKQADLETSNQNIIISSNTTDNIFDIALFNKYTELSMFKQIGENEHLGLFFSEEIYDNGILSLLVPEGKNPYAGLILNKDNSVDGQEHKIHSFEDYQKYSRYTNKDD